MKQNETINTPVFSYLNNIDIILKKVCQATKPEHFTDVQLVFEALQVNSCFLIHKTFSEME